MVKSCSILITNQNSYEAVQVCIESVKYHTKYPNYQIIVYDDCSDNGVDLPYLRAKQDLGWLRLIEGKEHKDHGGSLNILVNEICQTDLAMILDCDIQILRDNWLTDMINVLSSDEKAIAVCNCLETKRRREAVYVGPFCEFWFGLLNMNVYRDGMQVDWTPQIIYDKKEITLYSEDMDAAGIDIFVLDVGSKLPVRVLYDNPKGYNIISPIPENITAAFKHYLQITCHLSATGPQAEEIKDHAKQKLDVMKSELKSLRQRQEEDE